eukprot:CAMPEP_0114552462 /NCGR_PEP_ID=MMETSP0114-20121206/7136_1 /TAXON_ID=31324 /ORGANISM="Goniomonas sp, Strain m" /LENGTH=1116 /DNA_ID=CAMNT_0001737337 /DNA_START=11 /DNA_END=3361 /DNA_ORIENTATION=+
MSKKAAAAAPEAPQESPRVEEVPTGPSVLILIQVKNGRNIQTADRPTPNISVGYKFNGAEHETEVINANPNPEFNFNKEFHVAQDEDLLSKFLSEPLEFKVRDTAPVGKTTEKVQKGKVNIDLSKIVYWTEQTEEEEMDGFVSLSGWFPIEGIPDAELELYIRAPEVLLPKEELDSCNVITFEVLSGHALPPTWALKEGEDPSASTFAYTATYTLPVGSEPTPIVTPAGRMVPAGAAPPPPENPPEDEAETKDTKEAEEPGLPPTDAERMEELVNAEGYMQKLVWDSTYSTFLSKNEFAAFKNLLNKPFEIEVNKALKSANPYPYQRRYKGVAGVDLSPLLTPGQTSMEARVPVAPHPNATGPLTDEEKALVPDTAAPTGKGGKAPAAKGKGAGPEFEAEPEPEEGVVHTYLSSLTYLKVRVSLMRPIVPSPPPPKPPLPKVSELIPYRPYMPPHKPPMQGSEEFGVECAKIVDELAEEYASLFYNEESPTSPEERKQSLAYHLTKSGMYFTFKERLKPTVQRIVREKFHRNGSESAEEMKVFCNELYVYLSHLLARALNKKFRTEQAAETPETEINSRIEHHFTLAEEAEMMGYNAIAARNYNQRVVLCPHREELWYQYGTFCMRTDDTSRAAECFREAIALNPTHLESLLCYGALICLGDKTAGAETYFVGAVEAHPSTPLAWALLGLYYDLEDRQMDRRRAFKELLMLEQRLGHEKKSAYVRAAHYLVTIHATQLVERALSQELLRAGPSVEIGVLLGKTYLARKDYENARKHLTDVLKNHDRRCGIAMCLMGHSFYMQKSVKEAISYYEQALALRTPYIDITLYMRLAALYAGSNKQFEAKDYYLRASKLHPSASSWLGLGQTCFHMAQYQEAEEALAEANIMDSHNPEVWGWLAILNLKVGQIQEADTAYREALKNGLQTLVILREIGRGYLKHGKCSVAEAALRRALTIAEDNSANRLLGDVLTEQSDLQPAIDAYKKVVAGARSGDDRRHALRQLVAHSKTLNRPDDAAAYAQLPEVAPVDTTTRCRVTLLHTHMTRGKPAGDDLLRVGGCTCELVGARVTGGRTKVRSRCAPVTVRPCDSPARRRAPVTVRPCDSPARRRAPVTANGG